MTLEEDTPRRASLSERNAQVAALTGLRGFAALMVVLVHVSGLTAYAWIGLPSYGPVSLFVLSGYLLYRPWAKWGLQSGDRPSLGVFARRRAARIFPAYLVVFFTIVLIYPPARPVNAHDWLSMVTLTWIYENRYLPTSFVQTWSLATELSWYVALPVMAVVTTTLARRRSVRAGFWVTCALLGASVPVSAAWRAWVSTQDNTHAPYSLWLPGFLVCFAGGALVAHVVEGSRAGVVQPVRLRRLANDRWALLSLALAAALLGTSALGGPPGFPDTFAQEQFRLACATAIAFVLLLGAALGAPETPLNVMLGSRPAAALGRWSYGLFLWHFPLLIMLEDALDYPSGALGFLSRLGLVLAISIPLSAATYAWVERPTIAWSQRPQRERRERTTAATAPAVPTSTTSAQAAAPTAAELRNDSAGG